MNKQRRAWKISQPNARLHSWLHGHNRDCVLLQGCPTEAPVGSSMAASTGADGAAIGSGESSEAQEGLDEAPVNKGKVKEVNEVKDATETGLAKEKGQEKTEGEKEKETDAKEAKKKKRYRVDERLLLAFRWVRGSCLHH